MTANMNSNSLPAPASLPAKALKPSVVPITAIDPALAMPVITTIKQTVMDTGKLSKVEAFALLDQLIEKGLQDDFVKGGVLSRIRDRSKHDKAWLEGYPNFKSLVEERFNCVYRTALYLINNYLYLVKNNIPAETMKGVGWTKIKLLVEEEKLTNGNAAKWAKKAKKLSVKKLKASLAKPVTTKSGGAAKKPTAPSNEGKVEELKHEAPEWVGGYVPPADEWDEHLDMATEALEAAFPSADAAPMKWLDAFQRRWPKVVVTVEFVE